MSSTATTHAARDHARAQSGTVVETMPTIPATAATDLPPGVEPATVVWDELVSGGGYTAKAIARGTHVLLTDRDGDACANMVVHNLAQPTERLNVADTGKVQWQVYLGAGAVLLSDMGRAMATLAADTSGVHDTISGCSNRASNAARYGDGRTEGPCPNARDHLAVSLAKWGLDRRDVPPPITLFKGVRIAPDGSMVWQDAPTPTGAVVELVAEIDVLLTVANVPHPLDPRPDYTVSPLRVTAWSGAPTTPTDEQWTSTPERERAYRNTEAWLAGHPTGGRA